MYRNPKLWIVLGVAAVAIAIAAPNPVALLPILLIAVCPLAMMLMMGGMAGIGRAKPSDEASPQPADPDEVARLRAEVAELRDRASR
jgi:hypothetical protein